MAFFTRLAGFYVGKLDILLIIWPDLLHLVWLNMEILFLSVTTTFFFFNNILDLNNECNNVERLTPSSYYRAIFCWFVWLTSVFLLLLRRDSWSERSRTSGEPAGSVSGHAGPTHPLTLPQSTCQVTTCPTTHGKIILI